MKRISIHLFSILALILVCTSCYDARIVTGKQPSAKVIEKPFASGWVYGLVPPNEVKAARGCPNGVAEVETKLSFVNMLVSDITFGIYTPMDIKVTCAAQSGMSSLKLPQAETMTLSMNSSNQEIINTFKKASDKTVQTQKKVFVKFK